MSGAEDFYCGVCKEWTDDPGTCPKCVSAERERVVDAAKEIVRKKLDFSWLSGLGAEIARDLEELKK